MPEARIVFAIFFGVTTYSLIHGLAGGSAVYARADLAVGIVLCLIQFAAVVLIFHAHWPRLTLSRWGAGRIGPG